MKNKKCDSVVFKPVRSPESGVHYAEYPIPFLDYEARLKEYNELNRWVNTKAHFSKVSDSERRIK